MYSSQNIQNDIVVKLYQDKRTVFKISDIALLTEDNHPTSLARRLNYYVKTGKILNPRKGIYSKPEYNSAELASKLYTPSYISLQYVLQRAGIIFQYSETITTMSYLSREVEVDGQTFTYRKAKQQILYNWAGVIQSEQGILQATPERAFLDLCYLESGFYFDNLNPLDRNLISELLAVYSSSTLSLRVKKILES
ncbi:MAG: hypothetical protein HOG34_01310 [Bacteroidetes bacterium]|nr:hypothetical protein [Bacteroidota bacterium]